MTKTATASQNGIRPISPSEKTRQIATAVARRPMLEWVKPLVEAT